MIDGTERFRAGFPAQWGRRAGALAPALLVAALLSMLLACSDGSGNVAAGDEDPVVPAERIVGTATARFVDGSRVTAAHDTVPESPERILQTTILYPAGGEFGDPPTEGAPADKSAAPYPLVVLAHGLGASVDYLLSLAEVLAEAGYVVALPVFPLTNSETQGGPVAQDVQNQPADISFIIDTIVAESGRPDTALSGLVDGESIAVGGHSNGGVSTYGVIAHSCCKDSRVDAALIYAGSPSPFGGGEYDLQDTPPTLLVHGVDDALIVYNQSVRSYNELRPPKGLLSLEEAGHGEYFDPESAEFPVLAGATLDFVDGILGGDAEALTRLPDNRAPGIATMHWAPDEASNTPLEPLPEVETNRQAVLSAYNNLADGDVITVTWSGFLPERTISVVQCIDDLSAGSAGCNISGGAILRPDPEGFGSLDLVVRTGEIGSGVCDADNSCLILVNDAGLADEDATLRIPITFGP